VEALEKDIHEAAAEGETPQGNEGVGDQGGTGFGRNRVWAGRGRAQGLARRHEQRLSIAMAQRSAWQNVVSRYAQDYCDEIVAAGSEGEAGFHLPHMSDVMRPQVGIVTEAQIKTEVVAETGAGKGLSRSAHTPCREND